MPNSALARSVNAKSVPSLIQKFPSETIGSVDETKAVLSGIFPDLKWREGRERYGFFGVIMHILMGSGGGRSIHLQQIGEGEVLFLSVESRDKGDIERVAQQMGLRVIDKHFGAVGG